MNGLAKYSPWGIAILRFAVGLVFAMHGAQKLFTFGIAGTTQFFTQAGIPLPGLTAPLVTLVEFFGGIMLMLGVGTRIAALLLAFDMLGAILLVHLKNGFFMPTGFEYAFSLLAANIGLVLLGPGAAAIDNRLRQPGTTAADDVARAA
jgi:putative oxidoreductase